MSTSPKISPELDVLIKARSHLTIESNWCNSRPGGKDGDSMCIGYTLKTFLVRDYPNQSISVLGLIASQIPEDAVMYRPTLGTAIDRMITYNDSCTHPELLEWLDRCIIAQSEKDSVNIQVAA